MWSHLTQHRCLWKQFSFLTLKEIRHGLSYPFTKDNSLRCTGCSVDVYSVKTNRSKQSRKLYDGCAGTASMGDSCCLVLTLCADEIITIDSESDFSNNYLCYLQPLCIYNIGFEWLQFWNYVHWIVNFMWKALRFARKCSSFQQR